MEKNMLKSEDATFFAKISNPSISNADKRFHSLFANVHDPSLTTESKEVKTIPMKRSTLVLITFLSNRDACDLLLGHKPQCEQIAQ